MHDSQDMLPGEFFAVVAFLFAPPLLLALAFQTLLFARRRLFLRGSVGRVIAAYVGTVFGSLCIGSAIHQLAPKSLSPVLRVREVAIGSQSWPVMPLAFLAVAVAASALAWWALARANADA
jgi:hypothetical protein